MSSKTQRNVMVLRSGALWSPGYTYFLPMSINKPKLLKRPMK